MKGITYWMTGLSGAGKTTIAELAVNQMQKEKIPVVWLDGDMMRKGLCHDLGFSNDDRTENIRRIAHVAKQINDNGIDVIVSMITPRYSQRQLANIILLKSFREVYISTPLTVCEDRDPKGLYKKARKGEIENFTGIGSIYENPQNPSLQLTHFMTAHESARRLFKYIKQEGAENGI